MNSTSVGSCSMKWPLVPAAFVLPCSHSPRIEDSTALSFPDQGREPEAIKFPLHSRSGCRKKTWIDSGSLDSSCSAAKEVGEHRAALGRHISFFLEKAKNGGQKQNGEHLRLLQCLPFLPTSPSLVCHMPAWATPQQKPTGLWSPSFLGKAAVTRKSQLDCSIVKEIIARTYHILLK